MAGSIKKSISFSAVAALVLFVMISFAVSYTCVRAMGAKYQRSLAYSALDFAELTIDADKAKESFLTRNRSGDYDSVSRKLASYQENNSSAIKNISLVSFSNSAGGYIYDTGGKALGARLEYDSYTSSVKAELINGRNTIERKDRDGLTVYRPIRTVDDTLCGYIIVELRKPYENAYFRYILFTFAGLLLLSIVFVIVFVCVLNRRLLHPIRRMTKAALYLTGDDSASEGKDVSVIFDTDRNDEIGRLGEAFKKIFFNMNSGAEHLSQALYDANHDGMTQHLNKRCYHSMVEKFRSCNTIAAIYFDVNNLKLMNDTLGHEHGDYVIKAAADYLRKFIGENDYCFRMGGDEFLLIMTDCTYRYVDRIMDRLDKDAPYILSSDEDSIKCAISYGCAYAGGEYVYEEMLAEAEDNMYLKKAELKKQLNMPER